MTINAGNPTEYLTCEMEDFCIWVDAADEEEAVHWFVGLLPDEDGTPVTLGDHTDGNGFWPVFDSTGELVNHIWVPDTRPNEQISHD